MLICTIKRRNSKRKITQQNVDLVMFRFNQVDILINVYNSLFIL